MFRYDEFFRATNVPKFRVSEKMNCKHSKDFEAGEKFENSKKVK